MRNEKYRDTVRFLLNSVLPKFPFRDIIAGMINTRFINIFRGVDLAKRRIPLIFNDSGQKGPVVWVVAAIHGDEVTGTETVLRLNRYLKKTSFLRGQVYCLPIMNPTGYELISRTEPMESTDLNRCFPGSPDGNTGERIAHKIYSEIVDTKPDLVIDLHTDTMESIPYVYLDQVLNKRESDMLKKLLFWGERSGINYFIENEKTYAEEQSVTGSLINTAKIPAFTVELGGPLLVKEKFVEVGLEVVKNALSELKMIDPTRVHWTYKSKIPIDGVYDTVWNTYTSDYSGIVEYKVQPGDIVKKGDTLARIKNLFDKTIQVIKAKEDSIVISYIDQSVCFPGTELFMCAKKNDELSRLIQ